MRVSDTPICTVCYDKEVTSEFVINDRGILALCADCERSLRTGDRERIFDKLAARNQQDRGPRVSDQDYRTIINEVLDQIYLLLEGQVN